MSDTIDMMNYVVRKTSLASHNVHGGKIISIFLLAEDLVIFKGHISLQYSDSFSNSVSHSSVASSHRCGILLTELSAIYTTPYCKYHVVDQSDYNIGFWLCEIPYNLNMFSMLFMMSVVWLRPHFCVQEGSHFCTLDIIRHLITPYEIMHAGVYVK